MVKTSSCSGWKQAVKKATGGEWYLFIRGWCGGGRIKRSSGSSPITSMMLTPSKNNVGRLPAFSGSLLPVSFSGSLTLTAIQKSPRTPKTLPPECENCGSGIHSDTNHHGTTREIWMENVSEQLWPWTFCRYPGELSYLFDNTKYYIPVENELPVLQLVFFGVLRFFHYDTIEIPFLDSCP